MNTPAGWYPHPKDPGKLRWWDGFRWTEHTQPQVMPPLVAPPKRKKGLAITAAVLAVAGFVLMAGLFGKVLLIVSFAVAIIALARRQRLKALTIACLCIVPPAFLIGIAISGSNSAPKSEAVSESVTVVETDYKTLAERDLALIFKDPEGHKDERVVLYAKVSQFDSATGECSFRGNVSAVPVENSWDYDENIFLAGGSGGVSCGELEDYVEDDEVKILATSQGEIKYKNTMGANISAPEFRIDRIERLVK